MTDVFERPARGEKVMPIMEGYRMKCCDCGLVHVVNFEIVEVLHDNPDGSHRTDTPDNVDKLRVVFSMARETPPGAQGGEAVGTVMAVSLDEYGEELAHIGWHRSVPKTGTKLYTHPAIAPQACNCTGAGKVDPKLHAPNCPAREEAGHG